MSLATYISLECEQDPVLDFSDTGTCSFIFVKTDALPAFVTRFVTGEARVEPREYFFKSAELRKQLNSMRPKANRHVQKR